MDTFHAVKNLGYADYLISFEFHDKMWPNPQFPVDLVTFTEEMFNGKFHFLCNICDLVFLWNGNLNFEKLWTKEIALSSHCNWNSLFKYYRPISPLPIFRKKKTLWKSDFKRFISFIEIIFLLNINMPMFHYYYLLLTISAPHMTLMSQKMLGSHFWYFQDWCKSLVRGTFT